MKLFRETKGKVDTKIVMLGLLCITLLEGIALLKGINGTLLTIVIAVIAATAGVSIPTPKFMKE